MVLYIPEIPEVIEIDPVGRRNIDSLSIQTEIAHISNTGKVRLNFVPAVESHVLDLIVPLDVVVTIRGSDQKQSIKDKLEFNYTFTEVTPDYLEI